MRNPVKFGSGRVEQSSKIRTSIEVSSIILAPNKALEEISTTSKVLVRSKDASVQNIDIGAFASRVVKHIVKVV